MLFRVKVEGRENLPDGQFGFVANHTGPWDAAFLINALPASPQVYFLGDPTSVLKARTPKSWRPRHLLNAAGARVAWFFMKHGGGIIPVDRTLAGNNLAVRARLDQAVDAGCITGAFPERTYAWRYFQGENGLLPWDAKGEYHAVAREGLPLVPITISNDGQGRMFFRKKVIVSISKPFDSTQMDVDEMLEATPPVIASRLVRNVPCGRFSVARLRLFEKRLNPGPPRGNPPRVLKDYYPTGGTEPITKQYKPQALNQ